MLKTVSKATAIKIAFAVAFVVAIILSVVMIKVNASAAKRTYDGCEKIYVNLGECGDTWWTDAGCYHRAYFFGDNTGWASLKETSDSGIYEVTVPAGTYTHIILTRCETDSSTWSSGKVYNQTGDIELDATANYIEYFKGANSTEVTWSTYGNADDTTDDTTTDDSEDSDDIAEASSNTMYINLGNCGDSWWLNEGCYHRAYIWGENDVNAWVSLNATSDSGIYSFEMPDGTYTGIIICRTSTENTTWSDGQVYNKTGDIEIKSGYNYISYFKGADSSEATWGTYGSETPVVTETPAATETPSVTETPTVTETPEATETPESTKTPVTSDNGLADNIQDGVILHAFNWSYDTIKANLADIAAAGYTTVQTSPVQQPKDYSSSYTDVSGQWWKLYQPVSFTVADSSWLGTKQDLIELCDAADDYGVKIICDIVSNHLGGNTGTTDLHPMIAQYEPTIYNNYNTYFHSYVGCSDGSVETVVWGNIGMPDLNTANTYIQERVISLLKECIDCGVDGFRFDACKHIETPEDGYYASNYWPNVVNTTTAYAKEKAGIDLYIYGELLNTPGQGRTFDAYTKYINIIDNKASDAVLLNVYNGDASGASSYYYNSQQDAEDLVLWAESHDTYMGNSGTGISNTKGVSESIIDKTWAIVASRADASALYFARPSSTMGNAGSTAWKYSEVAAVNFFHNNFAGASEWLSYSGNIVMNERYFTKNGTDGGAVIVNVGGSSQSVSMTVNTLGNGTYTDKITGNKFTVSNGKISGQIGSTGIAVIY